MWIFIGFEAIPEFYLAKLENSYPQFNKSYKNIESVVILGGGTGFGVIAKQRNEINLGEAGERLTEASKAFHQNSNIKIIISGAGGAKNSGGWSEYQITKKFLEERGVPREMMILEMKSRNTYENIRYLKDILKESNINQVGLITSAYHLPRAMSLTEKWIPNIEVIPIPVDYKTEVKINWLAFNLRSSISKWQILLHEIVGTFAYKITNRI